MTTDDVNDAAWILVHVAADLAPIGRPRQFTAEERALLLDRATLYVAVHARHAQP